MKKVLILLCAFMISAAFAGPLEQPDEELELITDQRAVAKMLVKSSGKTVAMAVDGLCCPTCGIGVKKNVQKLAFVADKGVKIDPANSMLIVTLKQAGVADQDAIVAAVRKAGYDPVRFYRFADSGAKEIAIPEED